MAELSDTSKKGRMLTRFSKYRNSVLAGLFSVIAQSTLMTSLPVASTSPLPCPFH